MGLEWDEDLEEPIDKSAKPKIAIEQLSHEELAERLKTAEAAVQEGENQKLRSLADMENLKRRYDRELSNTRLYSISNLLVDLLPVLDSLEKSLEAHQDTEDEAEQKIHQGIELIMQMFTKVFGKYGIKVVHPDAGEDFNPEQHEAVVMQATEEFAPNKVIQVLQKGYQLHERLIRPARVIVSKIGD